MDQIEVDAIEALRFPGSASNGNNALRTLRQMFSKSREAGFVANVQEFHLLKETGRSLRLNEIAERKLMPVAEQPLRDIIVVMRDTSMRNAREI